MTTQVLEQYILDAERAFQYEQEIQVIRDNIRRVHSKRWSFLWG